MSLRPKKRMTPEQEQAFIDSERRWAKAEALAAGAAHILVEGILSDSGSMALDSRLEVAHELIVDAIKMRRHDAEPNRGAA